MRLDAVQSHHPESVPDRETDRGAAYPSTGDRFIDPVAHRGRSRCAPGDRGEVS